MKKNSEMRFVMLRKIFYGIYALASIRSAQVMANDGHSAMSLPSACVKNTLSAYQLNKGANKDNQGTVILLGDIHGDIKHGKRLLTCFHEIKREAQLFSLALAAFTENMLSLTHEYRFPLWDSIPDHLRGHEIIKNNLDFIDYILFMLNVDISTRMNKNDFTPETTLFYLQFGRLIQAKMNKGLIQEWNTYSMLGECKNRKYSINQCLHYLRQGHAKTAKKIKLRLLLKIANFLRKENHTLFLKLFSSDYRSTVVDMLDTIEFCEINKKRNTRMTEVISDNDAEVIVIFAGSRHMYAHSKRIENDNDGVLNLLTEGADHQGTRLQKLQFKIREKATHCLTTLNHVPNTLQKTNKDVYFIRKKDATTESDVTEAGFWKAAEKKISTQCTSSFVSVCRL